jgi:hypothetical protein
VIVLEQQIKAIKNENAIMQKPSMIFMNDLIETVYKTGDNSLLAKLDIFKETCNQYVLDLQDFT